MNINIPAGQKTATLTVTNRGATETSLQFRVYGWNQASGSEQLTDTQAIAVSPPIATIASGGTQVVRFVLRESPGAQEDSYRVLLDQIPPPAEPGVVRVAIRMSIPIFAAPKIRPLGHIRFQIERGTGGAFLVATNDGVTHESIHGIELRKEADSQSNTVFSGSQYVLAGSKRRWPISLQDTAPLDVSRSDDSLKLKVVTLEGPMELQVHIVGLK